MTSANRWGKSYVGMYEVLSCARGNHEFKDVPLVEQLWICIPSMDAFERIHMSIFHKMCPRAWMAGEFNKSDNYVDIEWDPEHPDYKAKLDAHAPGFCRIWVLSYEQNPAVLVGAAVDGAWMDEPPPRPHVTELMARLASTNGWLMMTFTPVAGIGWWYNSLWRPAKAGRAGWFFLQAALAERNRTNPNPEEYEVGRILVDHWRVPYRERALDRNHNVITCTCPSREEWGTCFGCRKRVIDMASDYPDIEDREIRVFGEVRAKQGLVYKQFSELVHVVPRFTIPIDYEIVGGVDPGAHGFHCTIAAISPGEQLYIIDEMFSQRQTTLHRYRILEHKVRHIRPKGDWPDGMAEVTFLVDCEDAQIIIELNSVVEEHLREQYLRGEELIVQLSFAPIDQGLKARKAGFLRVQQRLQPKKARQTPRIPDPDNPGELIQVRPTPDDGEPMIYFFDDLYCEWQGDDRYYRESRILWEIMLYSWKAPPRSKIVRPDDGDEESAAGAHAMASFRYLVMSRYGGAPEVLDQQNIDEKYHGYVPPEFDKDDEHLGPDQRREKRRIQKFLGQLHREQEMMDDFPDWDPADGEQEWMY